jgi:DNA mismatch endonuclease (patch repair protein)
MGASSPGVRRSMLSNTSRDTGPELRLRSLLHRAGLRFAVDARLPIAGVRRKADAVFPGQRVAVFMDGCFWHGCPIHSRQVKVNASYWNPKIKRNAERDADTDRRLREAGWLPIRVWEHETKDPIALMEAVAWVYTCVKWGVKP